VALTGDAGDELFGGYDRYRALALTELFQRLPTAPRRLIGATVPRILPRSARSKTRLRGLQRLLEQINEPTAARYLSWMTTFNEAGRISLYSDSQLDILASRASPDDDSALNDPAAILAQACAAASRRDPVTQALVGDLLTYLPGDLLVKVDLASMAHSLECRSPFLDHRVVELAAMMPLERKLRYRPGRSKVVLKKAFADLLPPAIRTRRKMGFGVPVGRWFQDELKNELRAILLDPNSLGRGLFRPEAISTLVSEHVEGCREHGPRLWSLVMLELWFRNHLDARV
jgi:asparagine synthase (glutamine-hydrolysing)